jgi:hypothetical protein
MPILKEDRMTEGMRKTLKVIQSRGDSRLTQRAKAEQKAIEEDNDLRRTTGLGFRPDSGAERIPMQESYSGTKAGAGQRAVASELTGRQAAEMRRTASRQDEAAKRKAKANPPGTRW